MVLPTAQERNLSNAVRSTFYREKLNKGRRSRTAIVNGLPTDTDISDRDSIHHLCVTELGVDPEIVLVNRQGTSCASGRIRPLLVAVGASDVPTKLVEKSCFVNCSVSSTMCNIYRNLSKAESKAAYEERCRRQQAAQERTGTRQPCMRQNGGVLTLVHRGTLLFRGLQRHY